MARHLVDGAWAESHARRHLEHSGMKFVQQNFSSRHGEIDLVMRDDATLVFVEVRLRRNADHGHPAETITPDKQRRLRRTAEYYLQRHAPGGRTDCRFDVVTVTGGRVDPITEWFRNAFI